MKFWLLLTFCVVWNGAVIALVAVLGRGCLAAAIAVVCLACLVYWAITVHRGKF